MSDLVYNICTFLQRGTFRLFADLTVEGRENIPRAGPLIIVANHQSNMDPPLLALIVPRRLRFLAKDGLFENPIGGAFLRAWGAHPLNREGRDIKAVRWALSWLDGGGTFVLFPEGTRNPGSMSRAHDGVAQFALLSGAPLLPVGITGTEVFGSWLRVVNPTAKMTVKIGTPFHVPAVEGKATEQVLNSITNMIMGRIADLLPESYRGAYGNPQTSAISELQDS